MLFKRKLIIEFGKILVIDIAVPSCRMDLLGPVQGVPRLHMLQPLSHVNEVLDGVKAVLRDAYIRLQVLIDVFPMWTWLAGLVQLQLIFPTIPPRFLGQPS